MHFLQSTIREFASIVDKNLITRIFKKTMGKLLELTENATKAGSSRSSDSMQIDDSSNGKSPSVDRLVFFTVLLCVC